MNTFRTLARATLAGLILIGALAAESTSQPQYAYRILMSYIQDKERDADDPLVAAGVLYTLGAVAEAGAAVTWVFGDNLAQGVSGAALDPQVKLWTTVGLGLGGAVLLGTGMAVQNTKPADFRARFSDVLSAPDAETQNRLAAVSLWSLSEEAKGRRLTSAWSGILTPLVTSAITIAINLGNDKRWSDNLVVVNSSQILGLIGGISQLYTPSEEEYLYLKYQAATSAAADFALGTPVR